MIKWYGDVGTRHYNEIQQGENIYIQHIYVSILYYDHKRLHVGNNFHCILSDYANVRLYWLMIDLN